MSAYTEEYVQGLLAENERLRLLVDGLKAESEAQVANLASLYVAVTSVHGALDRLIDGVERELGGPLPSLSRDDKQRAVRMLDERGAFILRRAVEDVADAMGVSRITVYNYLNALHR